MNFNITGNPEYSLNTGLAEELINLYGILTKFLIVEKINRDDVVFGDYSHIKSDNAKIYDIYMMPETSEDWDQGEYGINYFGAVNVETTVLFVAKSVFDGLFTGSDMGITGNLVILPNNKIMEVTATDLTVPGINNLFTEADAKSIYKLTCKPYDNKIINELNQTDISVDPDVPYDSLDTYFQELIDTDLLQDNEAEVTANAQVVEKSSTTNTDTIVQKPIIDNTEDDIFGKF